MSDDEAPLIPVSLIKQYHYCPRIVYFYYVLGFREKFTESMRAGIEAQREEERRDKRRKRLVAGTESGAKSHQLFLRSPELGIEGVVDLVIEGKEIIVVERKYAAVPKRPPKSHIYQAAAYAMLVERCLGRPVRHAYLVYLKSNKQFRIELTSDVKRHVLWTIRKIREIIECEVIPPYRPIPACPSCGYLRFCQRV